MATREEDLRAPVLSGRETEFMPFDAKYSNVSEEDFTSSQPIQKPVKPMKAIKGMVWKGRKWTGEGDPADPSTWVPVEQKESRSTGDNLLRQLGLTARAGIQGGLAIPGMLADAPFQLANLAGADLPLPSQKQSELLTRLGLPEPESTQERVVQDIAGGMAGTGAISGLANMGARTASSPAVARGLARLAQSPTSQAIAGGVASGAGGAVRELGGGPGAQMAAGLATGARMPTRAPGPGSMRAPGRELELQTFKEAQKEGIVVPPSRIEETMFRDFVESTGGKAATKQQATIANQQAVNKVAKREAGLKPDQDLTESNLELARYEAAEPYRKAAALSPVAKKALDSMEQARAEAKLQYNYYKRSYLPDAKQKADALDAKADAYERVIEREAGKFKMDLVPQIREARVKIAKNHQVERALNLGTGDVESAILGRELDKRGTKAMTGGLRTIGKAQQAFAPFMGPRSTTPAPSVNQLNNWLNLGLGGLGASQYGPLGLLGAFALPTAQAGARKLALSKVMQRPISEGQGIPQAAILEFLAQQEEENATR